MPGPTGLVEAVVQRAHHLGLAAHGSLEASQRGGAMLEVGHAGGGFAGGLAGPVEPLLDLGQARLQDGPALLDGRLATGEFAPEPGQLFGGGVGLLARRVERLATTAHLFFDLGQRGHLRRQRVEALRVALDPARGGFVSGATNAVPALGPALKAGCACAVFASDPFEDGLRFAGMPRVHVTVTPSGPGGWISAHLYAVENGTEKRVGWGQLDLRFADASQTMKPVVPGQPIVARLALEPLDAVVAPGGSLKLVISQGSYGDNVYGTTPFPVVLEVGGEKSAMTLDSFERDASAFFEPPTNG